MKLKFSFCILLLLITITIFNACYKPTNARITVRYLSDTLSITIPGTGYSIPSGATNSNGVPDQSINIPGTNIPNFNINKSLKDAGIDTTKSDYLQSLSLDSVSMEVLNSDKNIPGANFSYFKIIKLNLLVVNNTYSFATYSTTTSINSQIIKFIPGDNLTTPLMSNGTKKVETGVTIFGSNAPQNSFKVKLTIRVKLIVNYPISNAF